MTTNDERRKRRETSQARLAARVEEDHRALRSQLDAIAAATTCEALLASLRDLPKILTDHFALEEQGDGLYDDLRMRCPSMSPELDALCDEHRQILGELEELCRRLNRRMATARSGEDLAESMMRDVARWLEMLRRHDHEESCTIGDVYYSDEGGRG